PVTVISKPIPASEPVHTRRLVEDLVLSDINFESPNEKVSTPVNPYENLSPLAQGMIWSIILDEPLSLKDLEKR
ncbi:MAG: hypothetical protein KAH21_00455, partial [Spirochaetaceae bacterium]|nr:hypothetical protein [Spirochaetaceae bacterium]